MRSILSTGIIVTAGALFAMSLGGCGEPEVAERPADEPVRTIDDLPPEDPALEEAARQADQEVLEQANQPN
jgi:hypothetical protein